MKTKAELPNHMTVDELAARWGMHRGSLGNWRIQGKGPKYVKIGKNTILYPVEEVEAWERAHMKRSTVS